MTTTFKPSGFLSDASYSFYYHDVLKDFENSFPDLEDLQVELSEVLPAAYEIFSKNPIVFSSDNKKCIIRLHFFRYQDFKGKPQGKPTPQEVLGNMRNMLSRASEEYNAIRNAAAL